MLLYISPKETSFKSNDERTAFLKQLQIIGIFNDATICFDKQTGDFYSVLSKCHIKLARSDVNQMGITTKGCRKLKS